MPSSRTAGRRPILDVHRTSDLDPALEVDLAALVERAIDAVRAAEARPDAVFGAYAELNAFVRAVTYHEGKLLEWGLERLAEDNPALILIPAETALPIVPAALELLQRNDWGSLEGLRLRSEVHYKTSYIPDLFLVDRDRHSALILDVKRSLASYAERRLNALRRRMMAAALIAGDWLHLEGRVAGVSRVAIAIVDGSGAASDHGRGIFALEEVGELLEVQHAGAAMVRLRAMFARRVQEEIGAVCACALSRSGEEDDEGAPGAEASRTDEDDAEALGPDDEGCWEGREPLTQARGLARLAHIGHGRSRPPQARPVTVGFARARAP